MTNNSKIMGVFEELEEQWGPRILMHHLIEKTHLKKKTLGGILKILKSEKIITEPRKDIFVRKRNECLS